MWPFSQKRARPTEDTLQELLALRQRMQRLEIAFNELSESHATLAGHHMKLRNQFHGSKGGRPREDGGEVSIKDIPHGDKAALRKAWQAGQMRLVPENPN